MKKREKALVIAGIGLIMIIATAIIGAFIYSAVYQVSYGERVGKIIDKQYVSGYSYTDTTTSHIGNDTIRIPTTKYKEAQYLFKIEKEIDGKKKSIWIEVTESEYEKYKKGDFYGE